MTFNVTFPVPGTCKLGPHDEPSGQINFVDAEDVGVSDVFIINVLIQKLQCDVWNLSSFPMRQSIKHIKNSKKDITAMMILNR